MNIAKHDKLGPSSGTLRLLNRDAFPLMARVVGKWSRPDGDGWENEEEVFRWNGECHNPLLTRIKTSRSRKQSAARIVRKVETMDDLQVTLPVDDQGNIVDLGRREAEVVNNRSVQCERVTSWEQGAKFAGGARAAIKVGRELRKLDARKPDKETAEEARLAEIRRLEERIRMLMGLQKGGK